MGKVYVDWFQNGLTKTVAAPFSLRPIPSAPVSFPIQPKDLKKRLDPQNYNIKTVPELVRGKMVDFDPTPNQSLDAAFKELGATL